MSDNNQTPEDLGGTPNYDAQTSRLLKEQRKRKAKRANDVEIAKRFALLGMPGNFIVARTMLSHSDVSYLPKRKQTNWPASFLGEDLTRYVNPGDHINLQRLRRETRIALATTLVIPAGADPEAAPEPHPMAARRPDLADEQILIIRDLLFTGMATIGNIAAYVQVAPEDVLGVLDELLLTSEERRFADDPKHLTTWPTITLDPLTKEFLFEYLSAPVKAAYQQQRAEIEKHRAVQASLASGVDEALPDPEPNHNPDPEPNHNPDPVIGNE